ncbi:MAG: hypothetical protein FWD90_10960 [Defluviitaleaceae bacterium]|nr:hypothetical protein [Defluviitaleaceae bacterium]
MNKKITGLILAFLLAVGFAVPVGAARPAMDASIPAMDASLDWLLEATPNGPQVGGVVGEWAVRALARAGRINADDPWAAAWLADLESVLSEIDAGLTPPSLRRWTDYQRITLALDELGLNSANHHGHNLIEPFRWFVPTSHRHAINRTVLVDIYALITLETVGISSRLYLLSLYNAQRADGTWSLNPAQPASVFDIDVTAMALQAIAPHYRRGDERAARTVNLALDWLEAQTFRDAESTAQMIIALTLLGDDYADRAAYYVQVLLQWFNPELGGFIRDTHPNRINALATVQAAYALTVYHAR